MEWNENLTKKKCLLPVENYEYDENGDEEDDDEKKTRIAEKNVFKIEY